MELHDFRKTGSSKKKNAGRKSTVAFSVKIWLGCWEVSSGTIECSMSDTGNAVQGVLSSQKHLTIGKEYTLVYRTKKSQRDCDVVVREALKLNHIGKYKVEIIKTHKFSF